MYEYNNKVVLITGAASGFGKLLAEKLACAGAKLVLGDLNEAGVKAVAEQLATDVVAQRCDVTQESQVKDLVAASIEVFGRLDIAINNAGIATPMKALIETDEADLDINFSVNTKGVFFGLKHQIPEMLKTGGGSILNVASMAGIGGAPQLCAYSAAKHAVIGLTRTAAVEYAEKNIRINAACPFFSPTPILAASDIDKKIEILAQVNPMKRLGTPEEMVDAMLGICSPTNSYMNGQAIAIDGGFSAI